MSTRFRSQQIGTPLNSGNPSFTHASARRAPALKDGQKRCPVCRNGARPTTAGHLRKHRDLFGHPCWNRNPGDHAPTESDQT